MTITNKTLSNQVVQYLNHQITKKQLIAWCEEMMREGTFDNDKVKEATARIGLLDAQNFELNYEEPYEMLQNLGYRLKVELVS